MGANCSYLYTTVGQLHDTESKLKNKAFFDDAQCEVIRKSGGPLEGTRPTATAPAVQGSGDAVLQAAALSHGTATMPPRVCEGSDPGWIDPVLEGEGHLGFVQNLEGFKGTTSNPVRGLSPAAAREPTGQVPAVASRGFALLIEEQACPM
ncbi:hypothetical protein NE237_011821 [Protea cynaroides]|uniref:Uncharacterized protein n=1 Tax=Protea cynaroides TaxID=273540 RepID=A0A9Q0JYP1_9MAGN|nr:hypothetical protein NE237_011821 [Protea cynaroides]